MIGRRWGQKRVSFPPFNREMYVKEGDEVKKRESSLLVSAPIFAILQCVTYTQSLIVAFAEGSSALLWSCVVRRPSVRPSSVRRPSFVNFSHFRLLLWNRWTEFNETWQEARSQRLLPSLCFSGWSEKQDGRPGLWLAETFSTSPLKPLNRIQRNLTGSKISMSSTKFVFFGSIGKTRWLPWPLIGWDIFDFSSETAEWNLTKLDRKQDLLVLYQVCVFRADRKNKMAALASDWLRHFRLLRWNHWTEFKETWQEARSQRPLPSLCFSGRSEKQNGRPGLWLAETFSTSPLKPLNWIQRNLTGSKISTSSTKFVFFRSISKQKCSPWLIPQKGGRLYSGARYVALWASCFKIKFVAWAMDFSSLN